MKYRKVQDGGEVKFTRMSRQNIACCDCGLVHTVRTVRGQATTTWTRDNRATAAKRCPSGVGNLMRYIAKCGKCGEAAPPEARDR